MQSQSKYVLITGASSGIGLVTATTLAQNGYDVFAGVRNEKDAGDLKRNSSNIHPVILDVTKPEDIKNAFNIVSEICGKNGLYALINNAGLNYVEPFECAKEEKVRNIMEVNFFGLTKINQTFIPLLRSYAQQNRNTAKIVNIASIAGTVGMPWGNYYHASKFAVIGSTESLRLELSPQNIVVSCVLPGAIKSNFMPKSRKDFEDAVTKLRPEHPEYYKKGLKDFIEAGEKSASEPEKVVNSILNILSKRKPKFKNIVGTDAKFLYFLSKFVPSNIRHYLLKTTFKL